MNLELHSTDHTWRKALPVTSPEWWRENRNLADNAVPAIPLRRGARYYIPEAHRLAHARHDPLLAPHGFFCKLPRKRHSAAIEFVETFGPLDWPDNGEPPKLILRDFWLKHLRYVSVVGLWEEREDEVKLRNAFSDLNRNLDQIHLAEGWEIPGEFDREYEFDKLDEEERDVRNAWRHRLGVVPRGHRLLKWVAHSRPRCRGRTVAHFRRVAEWDESRGTPRSWDRDFSRGT